MSDPEEARHVQTLERLIDGTEVFVDVGANVGFFTSLARARGRRVIAVEPFPLNVASLKRNVSENGWDDVEIHAVGLADREGDGVLYGRDTLASRVQGWALPGDPWQERIDLATLDALLHDRFDSLAIAIKVDIEGGEFDLLRGADRTLRRRPAPVWDIEIAFDENHPGGRNPNFAQTFDAFFSRGYHATTVTAQGGRDVTAADVSRWIRGGRREFGTMNYVFSQRPRA
jgi:FkbM family methyltransferase